MALAVEAARIIQEEGLTDFRGAKAKAAERLGLGRNAPLPDNAEIEAALAERTRIFHGDTQPAAAGQPACRRPSRSCASCRRISSPAGRRRAERQRHASTQRWTCTCSAIRSKRSASALDGAGHRPPGLARRQRLRRDEVESVPGLPASRRTTASFSSTVFPLRLRGHAPLESGGRTPDAPGQPAGAGRTAEVDRTRRSAFRRDRLCDRA